MKTRHDGDCHWYSARICDCGFLHQLSFEPETLSQEQANDVAEHQGNPRRFQDDQRASQSPASAPEQASVGAEAELRQIVKQCAAARADLRHDDQQPSVRSAIRRILCIEAGANQLLAALSPRPDVPEQQAEQGDGGVIARLKSFVEKSKDLGWYPSQMELGQFYRDEGPALLAALTQPPRQSEDGIPMTVPTGNLRNQILEWVPAEHAIRAATMEVEAMPADVRLTEAVILLGGARQKVAQFIIATGWKPAPAAKGEEGGT
jgi:hypothetical protein